MQKLVTARTVLAATSIAALALTGCSSSKKADTATTTSTAASASPTPTTLAKAAFVTQADAVCTKYDEQVNALPAPTSATDFATIVSSLNRTMELYPAYLAEITPIVDQSADKADLHSKWLDPEKADFDAFKPLAEAFIAAFESKDATRIKAAMDAMDKAPDHTTEISDFLKTYGLSKCAQLESA